MTAEPGPGAVVRLVWGTGGSRPAGLRQDPIARELHLRVAAHGVQLAELACSPLDLCELVLGFLHANGYVDRPEDISKLSIDTRRVLAGETSAEAEVTLADPRRITEAAGTLPLQRFLPSGCGARPPRGAAGDTGPQPRRHPAVRISAPAIAAMARNLQRCSPLFQSTGGVHAAALAGPMPSEDRLLVVREDIGRHNAVDKVLGWALAAGVDLVDKALLVTGRISAEIVAKAARAGLAVVLSRSAPTDLAVEAADAAEITLIGFARGDRANVYSNWWRVVP